MTKLKLALITMALLPAAAFGNTSIDISYNQVNAKFSEIASTPVKNRTIEIGFKYTPSSWVETRAFFGFSADEYEINKQSDTFRDPYTVGGPIQTRLYRSTAEIENLAGAEVSFILPSTKRIKPSVGVGYFVANWESDVYSLFNDNVPAPDHQAAIERGESDCVITGIETLCGVVINNIKSKGRISSPYATLAIHWQISDRTALFLSGRKGINSDESFSSLGAGVKINW